MNTRIVVQLGHNKQVELPEGYYQVLSGMVKPTDLELNLLFWRDGRIVWEPVTPPYKKVWKYGCVIRKGVSPDKVCERCKTEAAIYGQRYCAVCRLEVLEEMRKQ